MDTKSPDYDKPSIMKCFLGCMIHMLWDDNLQVNGTAVIGDLTGFNMQHQLYWTVEDLKRSAVLMNVSILWTAYKVQCLKKEIGVFMIIMFD